MVRSVCVIVGVALLGTAAARPSSSSDAGPQAPPSSPSSFAVGADCLACHNGLTTPSGEDVSIGAAWQASMMAHSARDPYWQAAVRREILDHPERSAEIQQECAACPASGLDDGCAAAVPSSTTPTIAQVDLTIP